MKYLVDFSVFVYIVVYVFAAPVQYIGIIAGAEILINIFKILMPLFLLIIGVFNVVKNNSIDSKLLVFIIGLLLLAGISVINGLPLTQIGYGFKTFLPMIGFYIYVVYYIKDTPDMKKLFRVLSPLVLLGIFLDKVTPMPWDGLSYSIGDVERSVAREWETFGVERLSGFQSASYDSAIVLSMLVVFFFMGSYYSVGKKKWYDIALLIGCFYGIYLTTFKTAYLFIAFFLAFMLLVKARDKIKGNIDWIIKVFVLIILLYCIVPPILSTTFDNLVTYSDSESNFLVAFLFASYAKRIDITWPNAVELLDLANYNGVIGRGLGGIGTAQQYGELNLYSSGDNFYVYLFVTMGYLVIPFILVLLRPLFLSIKYDSWFALFSLMIIIYTFGATINVVDSPFLVSMLGVMLGFYTVRKQKCKREKILDKKQMIDSRENFLPA